MKKILLWLLVVLLSMSMVATFSLVGCKEEEAAEEEVAEEEVAEEEVAEEEEALSEEELLRKETLYVNGVTWGPPQNFNPLSSNVSYPCNTGDVGMVVIYETLFVYNPLSGELDPLLATEYEWVDDYTLKVTINENVKFSDGEALTSEDVVYSYEIANRYELGWSQYWQFLDSVTAESDYTVIFKLKEDSYNPISITDSLFDVRIIPKHIWEQIEADNDNDITKIWEVFNEDPIGSGPYKIDFYDDTKITIVRDDNYWGVALFGKLPEPKYITHPIFKDNAAGNTAFKAGQVDVSQQFIPQVWEMWADGTPIRAYLEELPYYIPGTMSHVVINVTKDGLKEPEVRKAMAMAIDYAKISEVAMSGYSADIVPGIALQIPSELKYIDTAETAPYEFTMDIDAANALLDSIGAERGADGIRVLPDGTRLGPYNISCPFGWSDWNASAEIVSESVKAIGIEIQTNFPEFPVWLNDRGVGNFDLIVNMPFVNFSSGQPWKRAYEKMYSVGVAPIGEMAFRDFGRYSNSRVDEILELIPTISDENELKELYTELDIIYLEDLPIISLMYRPTHFFTVNESVWTGFAKEGDGTGIAPIFPLSGAGIYGLYNI